MGRSKGDEEVLEPHATKTASTHDFEDNGAVFHDEFGPSLAAWQDDAVSQLENPQYLDHVPDLARTSPLHLCLQLLFHCEEQRRPCEWIFSAS